MIFILLLLLIPFCGFFVSLFFPTNFKKTIAIFNTILCVIGFLFSFYLFKTSPSNSFTYHIHWFQLANNQFDISFVYDRYVAAMAPLVFFIASMVYIFSIKYMENEPLSNRYFGFLSLFVFAMLGIVVSANLFQMYIFWEMVGLSSYLLIGFWYQKNVAIVASKKAFIMNRIGDVCFLIGIFYIYFCFNTTEIAALNQQSITTAQSTVIGLLLFGGCIAKSAQFPLHTWLPDAMEGPTPASALIHAATMVVAGVYMMIRVFPILNQNTLWVIACIGAISMLLGGFKAIFQSDIKKVLAYSTISQLGLMMLAIGLSAPHLAFFHLFTHAFFKAGLFLCVGFIIYNLHKADKDVDAQNMYNMGGLAKKMPFVFICYSFCAAALIGLPLFSGFISKDAIVEVAFAKSKLYFGLILLSTLLTAFYIGRQFLLVFMGDIRNLKLTEFEFPKPPIPLALPLFLLAILSTGLVAFLNSSGSTASLATEVISFLMAAMGIGIAFFTKEKHIDYAVYQSIIGNFYQKSITNSTLTLAKKVSWIDSFVIDGLVALFVNLQINAAAAIKWLDVYIVDGSISFVVKLIRFSSKLFSNLQYKQLQWVVSAMLILTISIFLFLLA